jgi:hypothetical protein
MKKYLTLILLLLTTLAASSVNFTLALAWDADPSDPTVTKYTLYRADGLTAPFVKVADIPAPNTTYAFPSLSPGVYRFYVTASNEWGESDPSNTVQTSNAASAPRGIVIRITANP